MKLSKHVSFVGVQNPSMRTFDIIMETAFGTSYNSYVVKSDKVALIETAHEDYSKEYLEEIEKVTAIKTIDYVILNHTEPDHTGSLVKLVEQNPKVQILGTTAAIRNIGEITNMELNTHVVKMGETLDLGQGVILEFVIAPNLHWPDSMFTYLEKEHILFSCDVFGSHFCEPGVLDEYVKNPDTLRCERENYYNCIFEPFKKFVVAGMEKIKDKKIDLICPSHGPVLKKYLRETMAAYRTWSTKKESPIFVGIFYVSAYGYTRKLAKTFAKAIENHGIKVKMFDLETSCKQETAKALNEAEAVLFGSPTINRDALKPVWDLISCTDAITVNKKPALTFGSYGWTGEACPALDERLKTLKYNVISDGIRCLFNPKAEDKERVVAVAEKIVTAIGN